MISAAAANALNDVHSDLFVSDVSLWEITLKHASGKLPLPAPPRKWLPPKLARHQLQALPLVQNAIFLSGELPMTHSDPFDRMLAAQAIDAGMTILSPDAPLSGLGASRLW
jgi:PIN domain nuclease of toxin-antitoxin system